MIEINVGAITEYEMFGFDTQSELFQAIPNDIKLAAMYAMLKCFKDDLPDEVIVTVMLFLEVVTGRELKKVGDLFDYINKYLKADEVTELSARMILLSKVTNRGV